MNFNPDNSDRERMDELKVLWEDANAQIVRSKPPFTKLSVPDKPQSSVLENGLAKKGSA